MYCMLFLFFNLIIFLIPESPILDGLLYRLFTATALLGAIGVFYFTSIWTKNFFAAIISIAYFIINKHIIGHKLNNV